jgi:hypothetical protein
MKLHKSFLAHHQKRKVSEKQQGDGMEGQVFLRSKIVKSIWVVSGYPRTANIQNLLAFSCDP